MENLLSSIDGIVGSGNSVISTEASTVMAILQNATDSGNSATFYLPRSQADAFNESYWTPERRERYELEEVSSEEKGKIEFELGVVDTGFLYSNRVPCAECGNVYGAFEFIQQGIRQHGREIVEAALTLENASIIRVNPTAVALCPNCGQTVRDARGARGAQDANKTLAAKTLAAVGHYYICRSYGCCQQE